MGQASPTGPFHQGPLAGSFFLTAPRVDDMSSALIFLKKPDNVLSVFFKFRSLW
jgi:hypothetical protein